MAAAQQPLVLMMAGGTGGHIYPALAVADALRDRGCRVEWVGTRRGLEDRVVPAAGFPLHYLAVRGVRGKNILHTVFGLLLLAIASLQALWLVFRLSPRCVVGMGGYVAGPAGVAARILGKPLLIHEQNAVAGTTNRMLAPMATKVVAGFPGAFHGDLVYEVLGNPVRREQIDAGAAAHYDYCGQRAMRLLVLGGSLGARPINEVIPGVLRALRNDGANTVEVLHQAGEAHAHVVMDNYAELLDETVTVQPFIEDMAAAYEWADLVVCRAGALTVSELAIMGRPSILVPLPHAIDDHQTANAKSLSDSGGAVLLRQSDMCETSLSALLEDFLSEPARLSVMAVAASATARPMAAQQVCDRCEDLMHA
jgi:UDP-N-acetylglucosamine--N-acetylmuramyl-(pentapeptide) pyrophosphoryl-undecaprenol N-acetylglucosamine transferase